MDVGGLEPPRTQVAKLVRETCWGEDDLTRFCLEPLLTYSEKRTPFTQDEDLIVVVDVKPGPDAASSVE